MEYHDLLSRKLQVYNRTLEARASRKKGKGKMGKMGKMGRR